MNKFELLHKIAQKQMDIGFAKINKIHRKSKLLFALSLLIVIPLFCTFNYANEVLLCSTRPHLGIMICLCCGLGIASLLASMVFAMLCCDNAYKVSIFDVQSMYNALAQVDFELDEDYYNFIFISNYSQSLYNISETAQKKKLRYRIELIFSVTGCALITSSYFICLFS